MITPMVSGVVALLDALGTKGIWHRQDHNRVISDWNKLVENITNQATRIERRTESKLHSAKVQAFSDTIIVTMQAKYESSSHVLLPAFGELLMLPFIHGMITGTYLRGAISIGEFAQSPTMILGPAVDEAASWYELADWIGVIAAPSASYGLSLLQTQYDQLSNWFVKYEVPLKNANRGYNTYKTWALAWPTRSMIAQDLANSILRSHDQIQDRSVDMLKVIYGLFAKASITPEILKKYENTLQFFQRVSEDPELRPSGGKLESIIEGLKSE